MEEQQSGLRIYSLGIVVEDKELGSDIIRVNPTEKLSLSNGLIADQKQHYDVKMPNAQGVVSSEELEGEATLIAQWIDIGGGNRTTAPDVKRSETVLIWCFADTDQYYWTTLFREPNIRRLEKVRYSFSDLAEGLTAYSGDSSYYLEVSTVDKHIRLHTAKSNGEPYEYDIFLDTNNGSLTIQDDADNSITLISKDQLIELKNTAGTTFSIEKDTITMKAVKLLLDVEDIQNTGTGKLHLSAGEVHIDGDIALTGGSITANGEDLITDLT